MKRLLIGVTIGVLIAAGFAGAQNTIVLLNRQFDAEATGNVLKLPVVQYFWSAICAGGAAGGYEDGGWFTASTNIPVFNCHEGTNTVYTTLEFEDSGTEWVQRIIALPSDWSGAIDLRLFWQSSATTGNVVWQISTKCYADGVTTDSAFNAAQLITDATKAGAGQLNVASLSSVTTTGCAAGSILFLKILRDPSHVSDTIGANAGLVGLEVTLRRTI